MNRIDKLFQQKSAAVLNIYFTAGHPTLDSILKIVPALEESGVDLIEIGMPYSDPLADGETIQKSSKVALENGMHLELLFKQVKQLRKQNQVPLVLMGYYNQLIQFGLDRFLSKATEVGIDGLIIPDLPMEEYEEELISKFQKNNLAISFLVSPQTSSERIKKAARLSSAFLYVISSSSITGTKNEIGSTQLEYFKRVRTIAPDANSLIGFGIHDKSSFENAAAQAKGAIIGSAFIRHIDGKDNLDQATKDFVSSILQ